MGALTTWGRGVMVNAVFRPQAAPALGSVWVALTMRPPVVTDTGSSLLEPSASSYGRVRYGVGSEFWSTSGPGLLFNSRAVDFRPPDDDWGQVTGWALCTESTSGMALAFGALQRAMTITRGMRIRVPPAAIRLTLL